VIYKIIQTLLPLTDPAANLMADGSVNQATSGETRISQMEPESFIRHDARPTGC